LARPGRTWLKRTDRFQKVKGVKTSRKKKREGGIQYGASKSGPKKKKGAAGKIRLKTPGRQRRKFKGKTSRGKNSEGRFGGLQVVRRGNQVILLAGAVT